jgi:hypothetical protein
MTKKHTLQIKFRFCVQIAGHKDILEGNPYLKQRLRLRDPYITTLNVCQAYTLKQIRDPSFKVTQQPPLNKEPADVVKLNPASEYVRAGTGGQTHHHHEGYRLRHAEHRLGCNNA